MLISYNRPASVAVSLVGTGAAFITDSAALTNGRPADATRLQWLSGSQTTASVVKIQMSWSTGFVPRLAGFILPNLSTAVPAGVKVNVLGNTGSGYTYDMGGNSQAQRTVTLPSGAKAAWFALAKGLTAITGISFEIYNDQNSSTWATAGQLVDLGELWFGMGADFGVRNNPKEVLRDGILQRQSHNNQAWPLETQPYRDLTVNLQPMTESVCIGPATGQDDYQTVVNAISTAKACVLVPSYLTRYNNASQGVPAVTTGTISAQRLNRFARIGTIQQPIEIDGNDDQYFTSPIEHAETPP